MGETLDIILKILNDALEANPEAIQELLNVGVLCNQKLADHPTIQVQALDEGRYILRPIGLINGIVESLTGERVAMVIDDQNGKITGFQRWEQPHD